MGHVRVAFDALDVYWGEMGHVRVAFDALDVYWGEMGHVRVAFDALDVYLGEMGHVRVAFGALDVESLSAWSNCLWHRCYACVELRIGMHVHLWKWH